MMKEYGFYQKIKDWNFSDIKRNNECLTDWDMYEVLKANTNADSKILDLGTGGGEKVVKYFPKVKEIVATDFSEEMIKTAQENLTKSGKNNITFRVMDNLNMDTPQEYFDVVVARHTVTAPKQIYDTLKQNGILIIRGVDKLDCWQLIRLFGKEKLSKNVRPIAQLDYEAILDAGFVDVELVPIYVREYYETKEDFLALLYKTPILRDFNEEDPNDDNYNFDIDLNKIDEYIKKNTYDKGILLRRRYYGITARKPSSK